MWHFQVGQEGVTFNRTYGDRQERLTVGRPLVPGKEARVLDVKSFRSATRQVAIEVGDEYRPATIREVTVGACTKSNPCHLYLPLLVPRVACRATPITMLVRGGTRDQAAIARLADPAFR